MLPKPFIYAIAGAIVVGGGYLVMIMTGTVPGMEAVAPVAQETPVSFAEKVRSGQDLECTIAVSQSGATVSGTIRIMKNGDMRGDFTSVVAGREIPSTIMKRGGSMYVWGDMMPRGIKAPATETPDILAPLTGGIASYETVQHECRPWSVDESVFTLPKGVEFFEAPVL